MSSPMGVCSIRSMCEIQHFFLSGGRDQGGMSLGEYNYVAYMMYIVNCLVTTEGITNIGGIRTLN